jgi:hypothetical protein
LSSDVRRLFSDTIHGDSVGAQIYSLIETAKVDNQGLLLMASPHTGAAAARFVGRRLRRLAAVELIVGDAMVNR